MPEFNAYDPIQFAKAKLDRNLHPQPAPKELGSQYVSPFFNIETTDLYEHLSDRQPKSHQFANMLNNLVVGEIVGGTIEGLGYLLDLDHYGNAANAIHEDNLNAITKAGQAIREWTQEATPIYESHPGQFRPDSWSWWMSNLPTVGSTLSLVIPAAGTIKALSYLGRGLKLSKALSKTAAFQKLSSMTGKPAELFAKMTTTGVGQAIVSRDLESLMEVNGAVKEMMDDLVERGTPYDEAKRIASEEGAALYNKEWVMLLQDIPQYIFLNRAFGKTRIANSRSVNKALGIKALPYNVKRSTGMITDWFSEGGEEAYQYIIAEDAKHFGRVHAGLEDEKSMPERLAGYMKKGEFWTNTFMGAMGSAFMHTAGRALNNKIMGSKNDPEADVNQKRLDDIKSWGGQIAYWSEKRKMGEELADPDLVQRANDGLLETIGIKALENDNFENLKHFFEVLPNATDEELDKFGVAKDERQDIAVNSKKNLAKLQELENLYNYNIRHFEKGWATLMTQKQFQLLNHKEHRTQLMGDIAALKLSNELYQKLTPSGRELFDAKRISDVLFNKIKLLSNRLEKDKSLNDKEKQGLAAELEIVRYLHQRQLAKTQELQAAYSSTDKAKDKELNINKEDIEKLRKKEAALQYIEDNIKKLDEDVNNIKDDKWREKEEKIARAFNKINKGEKLNAEEQAVYDAYKAETEEETFLKEREKKIKAEISEIENEITTIDQTIQRHQEKIEERQKRISDIFKESGELIIEPEATKEVHDEINRLKGEIKSYESHIEKNNARKGTLQADIEAKRETMASLPERTKSVIENEINAKQKLLDRMVKQNKALRETVFDIDQQIKVLESLLLDDKDIGTEKEKQHFESLKSKLKRYESLAKNKNSKIAALRSEIASAKEELSLFQEYVPPKPEAKAKPKEDKKKKSFTDKKRKVFDYKTGEEVTDMSIKGKKEVKDKYGNTWYILGKDDIGKVAMKKEGSDVISYFNEEQYVEKGFPVSNQAIIKAKDEKDAERKRKEAENDKIDNPGRVMLSFFHQVFGVQQDTDKAVNREIELNERIVNDNNENPLSTYFDDETTKYGLNPRKAVELLSDPEKLLKSEFELVIIYTGDTYNEGVVPIALREKESGTIIGFLPTLNKSNQNFIDGKNQKYSSLRKRLEKGYKKSLDDKSDVVVGTTGIESLYYYPNNHINVQGEKEYKALDSLLNEKNDKLIIGSFVNGKFKNNLGNDIDMNMGVEHLEGVIYAAVKDPNGEYRPVALRTKEVSKEVAEMLYDILLDPNIDLFKDKKAKELLNTIFNSKEFDYKSNYLHIDFTIDEKGEKRGGVMIYTGKDDKKRKYLSVSGFNKDKRIVIGKDQFVEMIMHRGNKNLKGKVTNSGKLRKHQVSIKQSQTKGKVEYPIGIGKDGTIETKEYDSYMDMVNDQGLLTTDLMSGSPEIAFKLPYVNIGEIVPNYKAEESEKTDNVEAKKAEIEKRRQEDLTNPVPLNNYLSPQKSPKEALTKFREYLTDVLAWDKMPIGFSNGNLTLDYLGIELKISGKINQLGGGLAFLEINIKDVINAKYDTELAALEKSSKETKAPIKKATPVKKKSFEDYVIPDDPMGQSEAIGNEIESSNIPGMFGDTDEMLEEFLNQKFPGAKIKGSKKYNKKTKKWERVTEYEPKVFEDIDKAIAWFKDKFPNADISILETLSRVGTKYRHGYFEDALTVLSHGAEIGTIYHESMHTAFHLYATEAERKTILKELRAKYGQEKTDTELEELMAEDFRIFVLSNGGYELSSMPDTRNLFQKLLDYIKRILGRVTVDQFYRKLYSGELGRRKFVKPNNKKVLRNRIPDVNEIDKEDIVSSTAYHVYVFWEKYNKMLKDAQKKNDKEAIEKIKNGMNIENYLRQTYVLFRNRLIQAHKTKNYDMLEAYDPVVRYFYENPDGRSLAEEAIEFLEDKMFKTVEDVYSDKEDGDNYIRRNWDQSDFEINPAEKISFRLKQWLAFMPEASLTEDGEIIIDNRTVLNTPRFTNYEKTYYFLLRNLYGLTEPQMMEKLKKLAPTFPTIALTYYKLLNADQSFKNLFFSHFTGHQKLEFLSMIFDNEWEGKKKHQTVKIVNSNRQQLNQQIQNSFVTNYEMFAANSKWVAEKLVAIKEAGKKIKGTDTIHREVVQKYIELLKKGLKDIGVTYNNYEGEDLVHQAIESSIKNDYKSITQAVSQITAKYANLVSKVSKDINPHINESASSFFATMIENFYTEDFTEGFFNANNKRTYAYTNRNFIGDWFTNLHKASDEKVASIINEYLDDPMYMYSGLLTSLINREGNDSVLNTDKIKNFQFFYLDGMREQFRSGLRYKKLGFNDQEYAKLNMYLNAGQKDFNYYMGMAPADKPNIPVYKVPRIQDNERNWYMRMMIKQDIERINFLIENKDKYPKLAVSENLEFRSFRTLNDYDIPRDNGKISMNEEDIDTMVEIAKEEMIENAKKRVEQYTRSGIIKSGMIRGIDINSELSREYAKSKSAKASTYEFLVKFITDNRIMQWETQGLFYGDSRFYTKIKGEKNITAENIAKRVGLTAMGGYLYNGTIAENESDIKDEVLDSGNFNAGIIPDEINSLDYLYDMLLPVYKETFGEKKAKEILSAYKKSNDTDGQGWCLIDRYADIIRRLGRDDESFVAAYKKVKQGKRLNQKEMKLFGVLKGVFYDVVKINGIWQPVYVKYSLAPLLPINGKEFPKIREMIDMMKKNNLHEVWYESAFKLLNLPVAKRNEDGTYSDVISFAFDSAKWRNQLEVPPHHKGTKDIIGTQFRRNVIDNIDDKEVHEIGNEGAIKGKELKKHWHELNIAGIRESEQNIKAIANYGKKSNAELLNLLKKLGSKSKVHDNLIDILDIDDNGDLVMPLIMPQLQRYEQILRSITRNNVIRQKINGAYSVQVSPSLYTVKVKKQVKGKEKEIQESLGYKFDKNGNLEYVEVAITNWIAEKYGVTNGEQIPDELRDGLAYRIPYTDKNLSVPIRVKHVLPDESGSIIIVPKGFTVQTSSDFDVDELHIQLPNYKLVEGNKLGAYEYIPGNKKEDVERRYEAMYGDLFKEYEVLQKLQGINKKNLEESNLDVLNKVFENLDGEGSRIKDEIEDVFFEAEYGRKGFNKEYIRILKEKIESAPKTVEEFVEKHPTVESQNIRKARENRMISVGRTILQNPRHLISVTNPVGSSAIEEFADKYYADRKMMDPYDDYDISVIATRLKQSNNIIGIYANMRASIGFMQECKIKLKEPIYVGEESYDDLGRFDRNMISEIGQLAVMTIDDPGNPLSYKVNSYIHNAPVIGMLTLAVNMDYALSFINQPVLRELSNEILRSGKVRSEDYASINDAIKKVASSYRKNIKDKELLKEISDETNFTTDQLKEMILKKESDKESYNLAQLQVLTTFKRYYEQAQALSNLTRIMKFDSYNGQSSILELNSLINAIEELKENGSEYFNGIENFFEGYYPFLKEFYEVLKREGTNLSVYYPWGTKAYKSALKNIEEMAGRELTEREQRTIINDSLVYLYGQQGEVFDLDIFNQDRLRGIVQKGFNSLGSRLKRMKNRYPEIVFLRNLELSPYKRDENHGMSVINFTNTVDRTKLSRNTLVNSLEDMLNSSKEDIRTLAEDLVIYSLHTSQFSQGIHSFATYIPMRYLERIGFSKANKEIIKNANTNESLFDLFVDQFFQNNYNNNTFVPTVRTKPQSGSNRLTVSEDAKRMYKGREVFPAYVKRQFYDRNSKTRKTVLYRLLEEKDGKGIYEISNKFGIPDRIKEYGLDSSMWKDNNVTTETVGGENVKTLNIYWGGQNYSKPTDSPERILSNLAPRKFTWEGREYGSVEHAYQSNKSGSFDKANYDAYNKIGGYGKKIRGKNADIKTSLELMKNLVVESFKQNPNSKASKTLLEYDNFTHPTNELIDQAFLEGLEIAKEELSSKKPTSITISEEDMNRIKNDIYQKLMDEMHPGTNITSIENVDSKHSEEAKNKCKGGKSPGKPKAEHGLRNSFTSGGTWKMMHDLKGYPSHKQGGVDLNISDSGVTMRMGGKDIKARYGLLIQNK